MYTVSSLLKSFKHCCTLDVKIRMSYCTDSTLQSPFNQISFLLSACLNSFSLQPTLQFSNFQGMKWLSTNYRIRHSVNTNINITKYEISFYLIKALHVQNPLTKRTITYQHRVVNYNAINYISILVFKSLPAYVQSYRSQPTFHACKNQPPHNTRKKFYA